MDQTYPKTNKAVTKKSRTTAKNAKKLPYHAQRTTTTMNANVTNIFPSQREPSSFYAQPTQPHSTLEMRNSPLCYAPVNLQYGSKLNFYRPEQTANLCGSSASASYSLPQSHVMGLTSHNDDLYQDSLTTSSDFHLDPVTKHFSYRKTTHVLPMHQIKPSDTADFHQSQERFPATKFVSHPENSFQTQISQSSSISPVSHGRSCHKNEQMLPFYRWNSFQEAKFRQFTDLYAPALAEDDESTERAFVPSFDGSSDSLDHLNQYCAPAFASCNISKYSANPAPNNIDISATGSNVQVALDSQSVAANSSKNSEHANALGRSIDALFATKETGPLSNSYNSSFISNSLSCSILGKPKFNGRTLFEGSSVNEFDHVYNFNSVSISQNKKDLLIDLLFSSPIEKSCKQSDSTSVSQTLYVNTWTESIKDLHGMNINTTTKSHAKEQTTGHYGSKTEHYDLKVIPASAKVTDSNADTSYNLSNTVPVKNDESASFSASYDDSNTTIFDLELIEPTIPVTSSIASSTVSNSNITNLSFPPHAEVDSCGIGYLPLDHRILTESFTSIIPGMSEDFLAPFRGLTGQKNPEQSANDRSASPSSASLGYISGSSFLSSPCNFSECRELATFGSNQNDEVQTSRLCDSSLSF